MYSYLSFDWKANSSMVRIKVPSDLSSNPTSGDFSDEGAVGKICEHLGISTGGFNPSLTSAICADKVQDTLSKVGNRLEHVPIGVWVIATIQPPLPAFELSVIQ